MCTVTLLPASRYSAPLRLAASRDEQHARAAALPPQNMRFGARTALLPIDPVGGGTWVAVNNAGLVLTLLNLNLPGAAAPRGAGASVLPASRGGVIPGLLHHAAAGDAAAQAARIDARAVRPFRLVIADAKACAVVRADGVSVAVELNPLGGDAQMWTSSGLGDDRVEPPRRGLFDAAPPRTAAAQDAFHRHRWARRPELSVAMHRDDARTVSRTVVEVGPRAVTMTYTPVGADRTPGPVATASLPRLAGVTA